MAEVSEQFSTDGSMRIRDIEEKQRLLKDRLVLLGKSIVEERQESSKSLRELKATVATLREENNRMKEVLKNITEQLGTVARKEELLTIQRQLDLLRN